jgi:bacterioferritin-associated ferredoxin
MSAADDPIVCFCNEIRLSEIVGALDAGATSLADIFDATWAGCGPCGGSCQPDLQAILEDYMSAPVQVAKAVNER